MSNLSTFILGATAGAAVALFFTSDKGKQIIRNITDQYDDKVVELSDALKDRVDTVDHALKDRIDRAAHKMII